jgi:hypothetical protein
LAGVVISLLAIPVGAQTEFAKPKMFRQEGNSGNNINAPEANLG